VGVHEHCKGERHEPELQQRRRSPQIHQRPAAHRRPDQRHGALHERHEERKHESEMANLYEHAAVLLPLFPCRTGKLRENPGGLNFNSAGY
jgi:hypothetical protein